MLLHCRIFNSSLLTVPLRSQIIELVDKAVWIIPSPAQLSNNSPGVEWWVHSDSERCRGILTSAIDRKCSGCESRTHARRDAADSRHCTNWHRRWHSLSRSSHEYRESLTIRLAETCGRTEKIFASSPAQLCAELGCAK
jgi:hypothetical protein